MSATPSPEPWVQRARVHIARRRLDREIAAGAPLPAGSDREQRARQLVGAPERRAIACALGNVIAAAEECAGDTGSSVVVDHAAVLDARAGLEALAERLRGGSPLSPRAVALAACLAFERRSPLVSPRADASIDRALADIADA